MAEYHLLTKQNPKVVKGEKLNWMTVVLHLMPWKFSGYQVCPGANGCQWTCLAFSGRGPMERTVEARRRRTIQFFEDREFFMRMLVADIGKAAIEAELRVMNLAVRLNGTSDIPWEKVRTHTHRNVMEHFPEIVFYDYTSVRGRVIDVPNYHITYSDKGDAIALLEKGYNVSMIFDDGIPDSWNGFPVIAGDETDLRFLDPSPCVVGLTRKRTRMPEPLTLAA